MNWMHTDPEILHGTPCFRGTRVPVKSLFDHLLNNYTLVDFLRQFPSVRRQHAKSALKAALDHLPQPMSRPQRRTYKLSALLAQCSGKNPDPELIRGRSGKEIF